MEIHLDELQACAVDDLRMIAALPDDVRERVEALHHIASTAARHITALQEADVDVVARCQDNGAIHLLANDVCIRRMSAPVAAALRDQLDVALRMSPPPRPVDPPSRL